jgi:archaeosortase A (PGF-CTERM-specific)
LIGVGFFWKGRNAHLIRIPGLFLFAIHWLLWTLEYALVQGNYFNAVFTILAVGFFIFLIYQEFLDYTWKEETYSLKWFTGVIFFGGIVYYLIGYNPVLEAAVIYPVAWLTANLMNVLGLLPTGETLSLGPTSYADPHNVYIPIEPVGINIILACTAIQAILIFAAVILFVSAPMKNRMKAFFVTTGIIYSLNIVRNISTIWLVSTGTYSFYFAHEVLGKVFSLIVLMILAFWTFTVLPEILDNIYGLADLRFRNRKGMVVDGYIVLPELPLSKMKLPSKSDITEKSSPIKSESIIPGAGKKEIEEN